MWQQQWYIYEIRWHEKKERNKKQNNSVQCTLLETMRL